MTILHARVAWTKPRPPKETRHASDLTPEEQTNVRAALRVLRTRLGGAAKLALALRAGRKTVERVCAPRGKPTAGLAIRAARLAGVPVDDVLSGAWPKAGACPHCGRI